MVENVAERVQRLRAELHSECEHYLKLGRQAYRRQMWLTALTLGGSALAALLGLAFNVDSRIVGGIALVPGVCASASNRFRLRTKTQWYYRKHDALKALLRRVDYIIPEDPTSEQVAEIATDLSRIEADMSAEWEKFDVDDHTSPKKED